MFEPHRCTMFFVQFIVFFCSFQRNTKKGVVEKVRPGVISTHAEPR